MDIREFKSASPSCAPSVIWDWCAKPTAEEIDAQLYAFSLAGISAVFIRPSKGLVLPYLSDDFFELIRTAARRSAKYNISLWICDENSPVSGHGGGEITSVPDYRMRTLIRVARSDVLKTDIVIEKDEKHCTVLRDPSSLRAGGCAPMPDICDSFVTECFLSHVYERYIRQCKRFIGEEICGFLTHISIPEGLHYYSPKVLGEENEKACADALISGDKDFENKYYAALSSRIAKNFTSLLQKKCNENDMLLSVAASGGSALSHQLQYIEGDCVCLEVDVQSPDLTELKLAHTICAQFEKSFMVCPRLGAFASSSDRYDASAFMVAMGADKICYDSVAFSLSDRRKYENHTVSLSKFSEKDISDRLSRFCAIAAQTKSTAELLIVYSPHYKTSCDALARRLLSLGIDFHIIDTCVLDKYARITHDAITVGALSYKRVICPYDIEINGFTGEIIALENADSYDFSDMSLSFTSDKEVMVNRRNDGEREYLFLTAPREDTGLIFPKMSASLFATDSSNGEVYLLPYNEDECSFTLKAGKTVLLFLADSVTADIMPPMTDEIVITPLSVSGNVPFALESAEENILPLKNVNACFGRKAFRENSIDNLHKEFYALSDNETVKVKYPFSVSLKDVGQMYAYIENADNIDTLQLNGKPLEGFVSSPKDPRFMGVDITDMLADGRNTFALEYKKSNNYTPDFSSLTPAHFYSYNITSFEPIYLCGDFSCAENSVIPISEYESDVTVSGMPYYYGPLTYIATLPEDSLGATLLKINGDFDICRVRIGKRERVFFSRTPLIELFNLDCGTTAQITVYNTPYNLMRTADSPAKPFGIKSIELCEFK